MAKEAVEKAKLEKKPWQKSRAPGEGIVIPRPIMEALLAAEFRGDRVALKNICNECRELSENQRPDVFKTHRQG